MMNNEIKMPASFAAIDENEMVYLQGGATTEATAWCCRPESGICRSPLLSCLMLRVLRATLRRPTGPLPQVHPDRKSVV